MSQRETVLSIQYLRAVAALMVVVFHASDDTFQIGMSGVDIFFVISGFIMWTTTVGRNMSPGEFMTRRLIRIAPLYWAMTLFAAMVAFGPLRIGFEAELGHFVRSLLFLPADKPLVGHPMMPAPIVGVGWTLNLEMFFYVVFALGLALPERLRVAFIVAVVSLPVLLGLFLPDDTPLELRFYTRTEILEFAAGVCLGAAFAHGRLKLDWRMGSFLSALSLLLFASGQPAISVRALHFGIPALLLVAAGLAFEGVLRRRPSRMLRTIGDASYSIYLTHLPLLTAARAALDWPEHEFSIVRLAVLLVICTVAGVIAYFLFEKPVDRLLRKRFLKTRATAPEPVR